MVLTLTIAGETREWKDLFCFMVLTQSVPAPWTPQVSPCPSPGKDKNNCEGFHREQLRSLGVLGLEKDTEYETNGVVGKVNGE